MKKRWFFIIALFIPAFHLYSQIYFSEQIIINHADIDGPESVYTADLDGDGDMDVLSVSWKGDEIAWYRNREATLWDGLFVEHLIDADFRGVNSIYCADIDGDGDGDVIGAANSLSEIAYYENLDLGSGSFLKHSIDEDFNDAYVV